MEDYIVQVGIQEMPISEALSMMMMEQLGYMCIGGKDPDEKTIKEVESVFDGSLKFSSGPYRYCKGGVECERFLSQSEQIPRLIERLLGMRYNEVIKQGPVIVEIIENEPNEPIPAFMRAHPSRDAVSVFRPLRVPASWANGMFKVYSSSHHKKPEDFENEARDAHEIVVESREVFVLSGALYVQPSPNAGIMMVWQGFSKYPILRDIDSSLALPYMKI